jgi:hypothetical protein
MLISQVKLEDVFRSTRESMNQGTTDGHVLPLLAAAVGVVVLLIVLAYRRRRQVAPTALNSPRRLLKEVARAAGVKTAELRQLRQIAEEQKCSSPLSLLLCPSLLAKGLESRDAKQKKAMTAMSRRICGNDKGPTPNAQRMTK